jgi:transposase
MGLSNREAALLLQVHERTAEKRFQAIRAAGLPLAAPAQKLTGAALVSHRRAIDHARLTAATQGELAFAGEGA